MVVPNSGRYFCQNFQKGQCSTNQHKKPNTSYSHYISIDRSMVDDNLQRGFYPSFLRFASAFDVFAISPLNPSQH